MKITEDLIKWGDINRPGTENSCRYITVHDTGNKTAGATARAHANYIKGLKSKTSWHYTVDDKEIYRHIPDNEKSYHTSDKLANESSIAIELCVNSDGDFEKTLENAAWLVRELSGKYKIEEKNIRRHFDWTGKKCPASLMDGGWEKFLAKCGRQSNCISVEELREMGYTSILL